MKTATLLAALLSLSTVSSAWPWPESGPGLDLVKAAEGIERMLRRQDSSSSNQPTSTGSSTDKSATSTTDKATTGSKSGSSSATATDTKSGSKSDSKSGSKSDKTSSGASGSGSGSAPTGTSGNGNQSAATTQYDPRLPPGGVQMITPAPISGSQFYKIGDWVTFAWNYTSLSATPSGIDIIASCASAQQTYTIALNQSISGPTGMVLWDTGAYQQSASAPLLTNQYTLIIYDAQGSISETPKAGYLGVSDTYVFGMYEGQKYTPWSGYSCAVCSSAMSSTERQTWFFLFGMAGITIASFTWFATGVFCVF